LIIDPRYNFPEILQNCATNRALRRSRLFADLQTVLGPVARAFHFGPRAATTTITCGAVLVDHVVLNDVHQTMFDLGKSDYPLAAMGVVAHTACDVVANLNLHCGLAEVDVAAVAQFKVHHVLHDP
jgi:hypothetical protein